MRLFVAIELSEHTRAELCAAVDPVRAAFDARWTRPEGWHLTVAFLGETPEAALPELARALDLAAAAAAPLALAVAGSGVFGGRRPRVLWLGVDGDTDAASRLTLSVHAELRGRWGDRGAPSRPASTALHLTVARARRDPGALLGARDALADVRSRAFRADALALLESRDGRYLLRHRAALDPPLDP